MKFRKLAWALPIAIAVLAFAPTAGALPAAHQPPGTLALSTVPAPLFGTVTNCTTRTTCTYAFNTSAGTGWANSTASISTPLQMAFQLPGEAKASYHLWYSTYIARLTGTYTYWTVGTFLGTDVNTGHVVYGTTNANYTITCHGHSGRGGGCTYTYTTNNGTIEVQFTNAQMTSTSISCSPTSTFPGGTVHCTATVTDRWNASRLPTGTVKISTGSTGSLSNHGSCSLTNATCSFTYHPADNTCGTVTLSAAYQGTPAFYRSVASTLVSVIVSGGC